MAKVVDKAQRKLRILLFGFITPMGIGLLIIYSIILIPQLNMYIIGYALGFMAVPVLGLIIVHDILMHKRWKAATEFLDNGPESGYSAGQALTAMIDFPVKMPLFGLIIWAVGGAFAGVGALYASEWKAPLLDIFIMFVGIVSAAVIITVFQFFYWRMILDPVIGLIIHRNPEILDEDIGAMRTNLKRTLVAGLIPLITLSLLISVLAGYQRAASSVHHAVGADNYRDLERTWEEKLSDLDLDALLEELRSPSFGHKDEPFKANLVRRTENGYRELVSKQDYLDIVPEAGIDVLLEALPENGGPGHVYDLFNGEIDVVKTVSVEGEQYYLVLGYPWENYDQHMGWFRFILFALMAVVVLLSIAVVLALSKEISTPIEKLVDFSRDVGEGNIHMDVFFHANDEVGDLALSLRSMSSRLADVLARIKDAAGSLDQATDSIKGSAESVRGGARMQDEAIDDVASAMTEMDANIQGIADNVEVLSTSAEESSSSIFEMSAAVKKINESVDILNESINEVSSSINEMTAAVDQVAGNVDSLSATSEDTASAMSQMDASIREVEKSTKDTADWSESVLSDAEAGVENVGQVTREMHEISQVVHSAQLVIERLGERVNEIGKIVKVIDDVANQTNLLALNAAIIAAQAGEHGRGFAVVADEIKQLAERTSGSTREIHQLIKGVQEESLQAVGAVEEGTRAVEEGVKMAEQASGSLAKIMDSTRLSIERVQGIARTTREQSESSRQVAKAIDKVTEMVGQISVATSQQSRGGSLILKATEEMKSASLQVKRNAEEQLQGSKLITKSIENITDMLYSINTSQQEQKNSSTMVVQLMDRIKVVSQESRQSSKQLSEVVDALSTEADTLRLEVKKFHLLADNGNRKNGE